jgi:hypothetical protein
VRRATERYWQWCGNNALPAIADHLVVYHLHQIAGTRDFSGVLQSNFRPAPYQKRRKQAIEHDRGI